MQLHVTLHMTDSFAAAELKLPPEFPATVILYNKSVGKTLAGMYLVPFAKAARHAEYDWYANIENDMNVTLENLEAICQETEILKGSGLMPGLMRYEVSPDVENGAPHLSEASLLYEPVVKKVHIINGRKYVEPSNGFQ